MHELSHGYSLSVGFDHRKKHGQFFTEERVARFMVAWVLAGNRNSTLFDPAFGLGAFYLAAKKTGYRGHFSGAEIDPDILSYFLEKSIIDRCSVEPVDYLSKWGMSHEAIVCNPPYMRFQKFEARDQIDRLFGMNLNTRLSGYTNIASAFLIKSISELTPGGRLAYIMPLEFLNTGYGMTVKRFLLEQGNLSAIIKMDCEKEVFPDATTSVGIILFEKIDSGTPVRFYVANNIDNLDGLLENTPVRTVKQSQLSPDDKWLGYFEAHVQSPDRQHLVPVSFYGSFSRGIATGANEFFALSRSKTTLLGLRADEVIPCITKSAQVKSGRFTEENLKLLIESDAPVLLLNITGNPSKGAKHYIEQGEGAGIQGRYLTRMRKPWFKLEKRSPSPLLFGVFSRQGFKVVRNCTDALNLTCYHGFSPNIPGARFIDHLFLYFLSQTGKAILSMNMRRYGDSLDKFEPNDLNCALCPNREWLEGLPVADLVDEVAHVNSVGRLSSRGEAWFSGLMVPAQNTDFRQIRSGGRRRN